MMRKPDHWIVFGAAAVFVGLAVLWYCGGRREGHGRGDGESEFASSAERTNALSGDKKSPGYIDEALSASDNQTRGKLLTRFLDRSVFPMGAPGGLAALFQRWFESDPDAALEALSEIKDERVRRKCMEQGIVAFAGDKERLLAMRKEFLASPEQREAFAIACCRRIAASDPGMALALCAEPGFVDRKFEARKAIFKELAIQNWSTFDDILTWAGKLSKKEDRDYAIRAALMKAPGKLGESDYLKIWSASDDPVVRGSAFGAISRNIIQSKGVEAYLRKIEDLPVPDDGTAGMFLRCLEILEKRMPTQDALSRLKGTPLWRIGVDEGSIALRIGSQQSPAKAMKFAESLDDSNPGKPAAAWVAADAAVRDDANQAAKWIESLPEGPVRDAALRPLLDYLKKHGEEESLKMWSELLSKSGGENQSR